MKFNFSTSSSILFVCFSLFLISTSCRKDLDFENSNSTLFRFSQDTVFLDTVFTKSNSELFLLKIFNDNQKDILISNLYLNQKENSPFRINVDGRSGFEFNQIPLRGKDSLMIFIEIAVGKFTNWLAEDEIVLSNQQKIKLLATVEDAIYHYPKQNESYSEITEDTNWDNSKSHIIYGKLVLKSNKTLKLNPGTRVYLHKNSSLEIEDNAKLIAQGTKDSKIIFRSDRHSPRYDTLPKQWNHIKLMPNSSINAKYIVIKGADNGLEMKEAHANLENVEIYNAGSSGIFSEKSEIEGKNIVISNAGDACLNIENGGDYKFYFSTFANQSNNLVGINGPNIPLYLSDYTKDNTHEINALFANSIFYGKYANGAVIDLKNKNNHHYKFENCLIKNDDLEKINYVENVNFNNIIIDNPLFISTQFGNHNLRLNENSPARKQGNPSYINLVPNDLDGNARQNPPSLGAYD